MGNLLEELTAPAARPRPEHMRSGIDLLCERLDEESAAAVQAALRSGVPAPVLSDRLRAHGWDISDKQIQDWRRRNR